MHDTLLDPFSLKATFKVDYQRLMILRGFQGRFPGMTKTSTWSSGSVVNVPVAGGSAGTKTRTC
jgi:hypothetical protein